MRSWSVWLAAVLLGGLLGWASGSWSQRSTARDPLPLLDVTPQPPSRLAATDAPPPRTRPAEAPTTQPAGHERGVRSVIERELPNATVEERDIWFEQLKELPPGVVEDLLNVRKQFRQMVPPLTPNLITAPAPLTAPSNPALLPTPHELAGDWSGSREAIEQLRQVTLHNLANAETPGYRRREPQIWTAAGGQGVQWGGSRLDLQPGPIRSTHRRLDVAIDGAGWFAVAEGNSLLVTRRGQFAVRDGALCLQTEPGRFRPVQPRIEVPESVQRVELMPTGEVQGWAADAESPQSLGRLSLAVLIEAGVAALDVNEPLSEDHVRWTQPGHDGAGRLLSGALEQSNVIVEDERARLQWIDEWLRQVPAASPQAVPSR
jgi:flagellar basal body rod protein FlgG